MAGGSRHSGDPEKRFGSRDWHSGSAAAAQVFSSTALVFWCSGRTSTLLTANDGQSLAYAQQRCWVSNGDAREKGFCLSCPGSGRGGEVEISAALKFTIKYQIREMFDFNNK